MLSPVSLAANRGQCCSVAGMGLPLYFNSIKQGKKDLTVHLSQIKAIKEKNKSSPAVSLISHAMQTFATQWKEQ